MGAKATPGVRAGRGRQPYPDVYKRQEVVKRIFAMTIEGYGPYQIASKLKSEKVLIPSAYLAQHGEGVNKNKTFKDVYGWGSVSYTHLDVYKRQIVNSQLSNFLHGL